MTGLVVFDTETDSPEPTEAHIVTAFLGVLSPSGELVKEKEWLVRPEGFTIPDEAIAIHGITNEHAAQHGRPLAEVLNEIGQIIIAECGWGKIPLAGQNLTYDLTVLDREIGRVFGPWQTVAPIVQNVVVLDSLVLDKRLVKFHRGAGARQLINLAEVYGVHLTEAEAHGARADAIAAGRIVQTQLTRGALRHMPPAVIHEAQILWAAEQAADFEKWLRTKAPEGRRDPEATINRSWPLIPRG